MAIRVEFAAHTTAAVHSTLKPYLGERISLGYQSQGRQGSARGTLVALNDRTAKVDGHAVPLRAVTECTVHVGGNWNTAAGHNRTSATETIRFRLHPREKAYLTQAAAHVGCTLSELVLDAALSHAQRLLGKGRPRRG